MTFGIVMSVGPVIRQILQEERNNNDDRDGASDLTNIMAERQIERWKSRLSVSEFFRVLAKSA